MLLDVYNDLKSQSAESRIWTEVDGVKGLWIPTATGGTVFMAKQFVDQWGGGTSSEGSKAHDESVDYEETGTMVGQEVSLPSPPDPDDKDPDKEKDWKGRINKHQKDAKKWSEDMISKFNKAR